MPTADRSPLSRRVRRIAKRIVQHINHHWLMWFGRTSYSLEGEDVLVNRIFYWQRSGFYVDVGAHHPVAISNTYMLYRRGWRGINIEPTPGSKRLFERKRPGDTTLEIAIGMGGGMLPLRLYADGVFNRLDTHEAVVPHETPSLGVVHVPIVTLEAVLAEHAPREIDFLSIDVEGAELAALQSNDWERFRPKIICAEILGTAITDVPAHPLAQFLDAKGYRYFARTGFSCFFVERTFSIYSERPS